LDAIVITQAYQVLPDRDIFKAVHAALHPEDGIVGMTWHRALPAVRACDS
jgi:hypothetical protein